MPFLKALLAAASVIPLASATHLVGATQEGISPTEHPEVLRVQCIGASGTAFRIGQTKAISVAHVTGRQGCFIENKPYTTLHQKGDFSILELPTPSGAYAKIDCNGFVPGRKYEAIGYARGRYTLTIVTGLTATEEKFGEMVVLRGVFTVIPGQSGGLMRDSLTKLTVGTVNLYDARGGLSASMPLKGTAACSA